MGLNIRTLHQSSSESDKYVGKLQSTFKQLVITHQGYMITLFKNNL